MEVVSVPIEKLKPAEYNPRQMTDKQAEDLTESINRFGIVDPIIVNKHKGRKNVIIGGHQRYYIAMRLDYEELPVVYVNLTEDKERELNLRLNRNLGEWDWDALTEFELDLLLDVGFEEDELDKYFQLGLNEPTEDEPPELPEEPKTKKGDIWLLGDHRVMCGDATFIDDVEKLMGGEKANMVFTDPPYNVDYGSSKKPRHKIRSIEGDKQGDSEWLDFNATLAATLRLYSKGDIYVWGAPSPDGMRQRLCLVDNGFHWSATIIWKKQQLVLSPAKYQRMYEPCFYGWHSKSSYCGDRKQTEVWEVDRPLDSKEHPTMKPIALCAIGIGNSSEQGDIVFDPFGGSGSTLIACEQLNRTCYMMEIDPKYCDVIVQRWENFTGEKAKLDGKT